MIQHGRNVDLKRGAFSKLHAHVATSAEAAVDRAMAKNAAGSAAQPVKLPRASVRDPLPAKPLPDHILAQAGPHGCGELVQPTTQASSDFHQNHFSSDFAGGHKSRLSTVGRLKMRANHPRYSAATHERARRDLAAMGLDRHGKPKRKHK